VIFSGASSLGGNITAAVLDQEYVISTVDLGTTSYTFTAKDPVTGLPVVASSGDTGHGGATVTAAYELPIGLDVIVSAPPAAVPAWTFFRYSRLAALDATSRCRPRRRGHRPYAWRAQVAEDEVGGQQVLLFIEVLADIVVEPLNGAQRFECSASEVRSTETRASLAAMKRVLPTGGLQMLMARLQTTIIPK
jgi:hypothetical protein